MPVFRLTETIEFPPPHLAHRVGLLAIGGDLSVKRLLAAYEKGIFPWFMEGEPILWWSPDPRLVLYPGDLHVSTSLRRLIRKNLFMVTADTAFPQVIQGCACVKGKNRDKTWLVNEMRVAYCEMHRAGYAHSVEAWYKGELAGGLYGVALGGCFFGESMFTRMNNASKVAFVYLVKYLQARNFDMIDCQVATAHLKRFGAREIPRRIFLKELEASLQKQTLKGNWDLSALKPPGKIERSDDET
jgi:leucyl/phenylalanyl-tRNA---protein transferase